MGYGPRVLLLGDGFQCSLSPVPDDGISMKGDVELAPELRGAVLYRNLPNIERSSNFGSGWSDSGLGPWLAFGDQQWL